MKTVTEIPNRAACKAALERALRETLANVHRDDLEIEHMADPVDETRWAMEREIAGRDVDRKANRARKIRVAIEKLQTGDYGVCERCENPIALKRLNAVPWAGLCLACQSEAEQRSAPVSELSSAA